MNPVLVFGAIVSLLVANGVVVFSPVQNLLNSNQPKQAQTVEFSPVTYKPAPTQNPNSKPPNIGASSALIYDVDSGQVLYEKNIHDARPMASLTKLMTALVILDNHSLDETVTIPELPQLEAADQKINITPGEKFTLNELMKALLIYSANDVANALAIWDSGSIENFNLKMNQKAAEWSLSDSHFSNPSGLDAAGHKSSVKDLQILTGILLHNQKFTDVVKTKTTTIKDLAGKPYTFTSTNQLLGSGGVIGLKTGFTLEAGQCLVTLADRSGHKVVTIVLNSPDRFQESKNMIDWAFNNHTWQ